MGLGERRHGGRRGRHGHRHHGHRHHGLKHRGIGRRRRFGRRRIRQGGALVSLMCCCFGGAQQNTTETNQNDIEQLQNFMTKLMAARQQTTTNDPVAGQATLDNAAVQQGVQQLQQEQRELLEDIMRQQAKEKDPQKLQELYNQQNEVIRQMSGLESEGFQYQGGIPPEANIQPMDMSGQNAPPPYAALY